MSKKMTSWFGIKFKPVRIGVYPVQEDLSAMYAYDGGFAYWDGAHWGMSRGTVEEAAMHPDYFYAYQHKIWRGFTTKQTRS